MLGLIDPPTPFSSTKRWEKFLANMKQNLPQDAPEVQEMIRLAEKELAIRRKEAA